MMFNDSFNPSFHYVLDNKWGVESIKKINDSSQQTSSYNSITLDKSGILDMEGTVYSSFNSKQSFNRKPVSSKLRSLKTQQCCSLNNITPNFKDYTFENDNMAQDSKCCSYEGEQLLTQESIDLHKNPKYVLKTLKFWVLFSTIALMNGLSLPFMNWFKVLTVYNFGEIYAMNF